MAGGPISVYRNLFLRRRRRIVVKPTRQPVFWDAGVPSEASGNERLDMQAPINWVPERISFDVQVSTEFLVSVPGESFASPIAWGTSFPVYYDAVTPSESNSRSQFDQPALSEWAGSVTAVNYDLGVLAEWNAAVSPYLPNALEIAPRAAAIYYDLSIPQEVISTVTISDALASGWDGTAVVTQSPATAPGKLPVYSDADFLFGMQNLLPTGAIWPRDADALQTQVIASITKEYSRQAARSSVLLSDAFPIRPLELLSEWEQTLGLPDPCIGALPTVQQRQQQVSARFIASGGQSPGYFISFAADLGYTITITQYTPFRVGQNRVGDPLLDASWAHVWTVNAPNFSVGYFRVGQDAVGEPLAWWGNNVLQCELQRLAPAHTQLIFQYS